MVLPTSHKFEDSRHRRNLGGKQRAGRYSRRKAWDRMREGVQNYRWMLILLPGLFILAIVPMALTTEGVVRGAVIGTAVASGIWFDALIVVVWTGAGSQFMGVNGEAWTSDDLRKLEREGWRLVNGIKLDERRDVDHILVGPGGVLVVESKWSADPWPLNGYGPKFMEARKKNAAAQVQENATDVRNWLAEYGLHVPVMSVAVLWTGSRKSGSGWDIWRDKHTVLVHGPDFRRWLRDELPHDGVNVETVDRLYSQLGQKVDQQDQAAIEGGQTFAPTLRNLRSEWAFKPIAGVLLAGYALWLTRFAHDWRVAFAATAAAVILGLWAYRFKPIRRVVIGWTALSSAYMIIWIVLLIRVAIR